LRGELSEIQEQKQTLLRSIELAKVNKLSDAEMKNMQKMKVNFKLYEP
jgi:23S rRNA maturation-related 3'-5' exoribonuclease YhaM